MNYFEIKKINDTYFLIDEEENIILNYMGNTKVGHANKKFMNFLLSDLDNCANKDIKDGYIDTQDFSAYRIFSMHFHDVDQNKEYKYLLNEIYNDPVWYSQLNDPESQINEVHFKQPILEALYKEYGTQNIKDLCDYGLGNLWQENLYDWGEGEVGTYLPLDEYEKLDVVKNIINDIENFPIEMKSCLRVLDATNRNSHVNPHKIIYPTLIVSYCLVKGIITSQEYTRAMLGFSDDLTHDKTKNKELLKALYNDQANTIKDYLLNYKTDEEIEILRLIKNHETKTVELKSSFFICQKTNQKRNEIMHEAVKAIAGFLNSKNGGILLIGVKDNKEITGVEKDVKKNWEEDSYIRSINSYVRKITDSNADNKITMKIVEVKNKKVLRIDIDSRLPKPTWVVDIKYNNKKNLTEDASLFYLRKDKETVKLNSKDAHEYIKRNED